MKNFKFIKKLLELVVLFCSIAILQTDTIFAYTYDYGDQSGSPSWSGATGCPENSLICWTNLSNGEHHPVSGVRISIVDGNGNMVSKRYVDYVNLSSDAEILNSSKGYYRCDNIEGNRLYYLKIQESDYYNKPNNLESCNWKKNDYSHTVYHLNWLPNIYSEPDASNQIRDTLLNLSSNELQSTFFDRLGYTPNGENIKKHYLIIEPVTYIQYKGNNYYGSFYEFFTFMFTGTSQNWVMASQFMPFSIYPTGNTDIKGPGGYDSTTKTYLNGKLKVADTSCSGDYCDTYKNPDGTFRSLTNNTLVNLKKPKNNPAYGIGIYWLGDPDLDVPGNEPTPDPVPDLDIPGNEPTPDPVPELICDYNNSSHFASETSGPNGENCCQYVLDNASKYNNITKEVLFSKYSQCRASILDKCNFDLTTQYPSCGENAIGIVKDIEDWDCIYASAYSNDTTIKNYFLKYGSTTSSCSVYCRDELSYMYPSAKMNVLAGNYFTIGNTISSFYPYLDANNTLKVKAASLGPIQSTITRECKILGTANNACINAANTQLNNISAPSIDFAYESKYYNNPTVSLASSRTSTTTTGYKRTNTYSYSLPSNTYKYVSKDGGTSYKNVSEVGNTEYIEIGNHLPIHFSKNDYTADYQITITKFNLPNFDNLILKGQAVSVKFSSSIETYIKTLIDAGYTRPINIGGTYYFDPTFIKHLNNKGYSINNILQMTCGNTNNYSCTNDYNGVVCYDKNTYSNSEQTYALFNACINSEVQKIVSEKVSYKNDMLYECSFNVVRNIKDVCDPNNETCDSGNPNGNPDGGGSDGGLLNVIYRPISLDNPFPSIDADGRVTGANWCYGDNCSNTNPIVEKVITNNRDVTTEEVYRELDPLYTITLTPGLIKEIREYNDKNDYDDFTLDCNNNGTNCKSTFIREKFQNYFSGCGIKNKSGGLRCQEYDKW